MVEPARSFSEWLPKCGPGLRVIASLFEGARPLRDVLRSVERPEDVTVLVGPEGDFTPEEGEAGLAAGFLPASLGPIVLRAETAAFFAISAVQYEFYSARS